MKDKKESLLASLGSDGWTEVDLSGDEQYAGMTLDFKQNGPLLAYKTSGTIANATPEQVLQVFWEKDVERRKVWDSSLLSYEVVESVVDDAEVVMARYSAGVPLVANRVFVLLRFFERHPNGDVSYFGLSVNHPKALQDPSEVRGTSQVCYRWTACDGGTRVSQYLAADPKGSLPAMVVNSFQKKSCAQLAQFRKMFA